MPTHKQAAAQVSGSESGLCQGREASPPTPDHPPACVHWYVMVPGGMRCKKCGAKL